MTFYRSGHHDYFDHGDDDGLHDDGDDIDDIGEGGGGGEDEQRGGDRGGRPQTPHGGCQHLQHDHDDHH